MSSWTSYPSIYNLGHRAVRELLNYPHIVEEKVDGSQFSFGLFEDQICLGCNRSVGLFNCDCPAGVGTVQELRVRSKGCVMNPDAPEKMFTKAVESVKFRLHLLHPGWTYRAEYLAKRNHNTLAYDRVPSDNLIGFDVSTGDNEWLNPTDKRAEFERIGLECVPVLNESEQGYHGATLDSLRNILDNTQSVLGGQLIEGVVIKPLVELYGVDKKTLMGKFVSERFKEAHKQAWKETSPNSGDILERLIAGLRVEGRWLKAVQHLRERGELEDSPRDIGKLLIEIQKDTGQEEKEAIERALWKWAWPHISRGITRGFPEWWKEQLLKAQFEEDHLGVVADAPDAHLGAVETE
jgi:hypothetical protein